MQTQQLADTNVLIGRYWSSAKRSIIGRYQLSLFETHGTGQIPSSLEHYLVKCYDLVVITCTILAECQLLVVRYRTEPASSVVSEHRAVAGVDFIAKSSSVDMLDGAVHAAITVTILPVSNTLVCTPDDPNSRWPTNGFSGLKFHHVHLHFKRFRGIQQAPCSTSVGQNFSVAYPKNEIGLLWH